MVLVLPALHDPPWTVCFWEHFFPDLGLGSEAPGDGMLWRTPLLPAASFVPLRIPALPSPFLRGPQSASQGQLIEHRNTRRV